MEFSAWPSVTNPWRELLDEALHIEKAGWKGLWIGDHFMPDTADPSGYWQESWTALAALAARVPRIRLGTLVTCNTYRNPCVLAKQVAQVDVISEGRVTLGIGAGWQENEHQAYGLKFASAADRLSRLEESLQVLRSLFDTGRATLQGKHYQIEDAPLSPRPVQERLPILVGGGGEKVTLRLVAQYADQWNVSGPLDVMVKKYAILGQHCERIGRDPATVHRTGVLLVNIEDSRTSGGLADRTGWVNIHRMHDLVDALTPYAEAGVDEMIVHFNPGLALPRRKELLTEFMGQVAPAFSEAS